MHRWPLVLIINAIAFLSVSVDARSAGEMGVRLPESTRSILLERTGDGYRWKLTREPLPEIGAHQVLVHVRAVALNRDDLEYLKSNRRTDLAGVRMGSDAAGDVIALGKEVTGFRLGERVTNTYFRNWTDGSPSRAKIDVAHGAKTPGVASDYIVLDDTAVTSMPKEYSYEEAATLPTAGLTAWMATVGEVHLGAGQVVLIEGTGGVSIFAMQFAAASRARIILTSSSDEKLRKTLAVAPHDSINYQSTLTWGDRVVQLADGRGADLIVDVGGQGTLPQALRSLATGGTLSIVGGLAGYGAAIPSGVLLDKAAKAQGVFVGSRAEFRDMISFIEKHRVHPVIDRILPFEQYEQALSLLASDQIVGKIVLSLTPATTASLSN